MFLSLCQNLTSDQKQILLNHFQNQEQDQRNECKKHVKLFSSLVLIKDSNNNIFEELCKVFKTLVDRCNSKIEEATKWEHYLSFKIWKNCTPWPIFHYFTKEYNEDDQLERLVQKCVDPTKKIIDERVSKWFLSQKYIRKHHIELFLSLRPKGLSFEDQLIIKQPKPEPRIFKLEKDWLHYLENYIHNLNLMKTMIVKELHFDHEVNTFAFFMALQTLVLNFSTKDTTLYGNLIELSHEFMRMVPDFNLKSKLFPCFQHILR